MIVQQSITNSALYGNGNGTDAYNTKFLAGCVSTKGSLTLLLLFSYYYHVPSFDTTKICSTYSSSTFELFCTFWRFVRFICFVYLRCF